MSGIESVDGELASAAKHLSNTELGLCEARKDYRASAEELGEVVLRHKLTVDPYVRSVTDTYEYGVEQLRAALTVFKEKVMPSLDDSGIRHLNARGEGVHDYVESVGSFFDDVLKKIVRDFFGGEVFDKQKSALNTAIGSIGDAQSSIQEGLLAEGNPLDEAINHIQTCQGAIDDYRQFGL